MSSPLKKSASALATFVIALAALAVAGCSEQAADIAASVATTTPSAAPVHEVVPEVTAEAGDPGDDSVDFEDGHPCKEQPGEFYCAEGVIVDIEALPDGCTSYAMITIGSDGPGKPWYGTLGGEPYDRGPRDHATGEVGLNADGQIETYTVAPGDYIEQIGERLCMDEVYLAMYNLVNRVGYRDGYHDLYPGEVLTIRPDPDVVWEGKQ